MEAVRNTTNLGMDLARFDNRRRVREAVANDSVRAVPVKKERAAVKLGLRPASVLLFMYFIGGILCVVFSFAQLSAVNNSNSKLAKELTTVLSEQKVLIADLESRIKLDEISERAISEFGFVKLDRRQIIYIDLSGEEKAEKLGEISLKSKILDSLSGIFK